MNEFNKYYGFGLFAIIVFCVLTSHKMGYEDEVKAAKDDCETVPVQWSEETFILCNGEERVK